MSGPSEPVEPTPVVVVPAPVLRRVIAATYDGLLLLALWMVAILLDVILRAALTLPSARLGLQLLLFLIGFGFFGWFWTHGGQTLGMRAWRLRVRRSDGTALRWPVALVRYALMLLTWFCLALPLAMASPTLSAHVHAATITAAASVYSLVAVAVMLTDRRRRAVCDFVTQTEVILLSKAEAAALAAK